MRRHRMLGPTFSKIIHLQNFHPTRYEGGCEFPFIPDFMSPSQTEPNSNYLSAIEIYIENTGMQTALQPVATKDSLTHT